MIRDNVRFLRTLVLASEVEGHGLSGAIFSRRTIDCGRLYHARHDFTGRPVEPGPGHVPVDLYNVLRHGSVFWFPIAVFRFGE